MLKTIIAFLFAGMLAMACRKPGNVYAAVPLDPVTPDSSSDTSSRKTYLALGDSYTIGQSVAVNERFPVQTVALLENLHLSFDVPEIIAQTGWTTGNLLSRIGSTPPLRSSYDIVTLLIGVNNQYQGRSQDEYRQQFATLLEKAIQYAGNNMNHVFVLSIPDYSVTPYANGSDRAQIAGEIDEFNAINKQVSLQYGVHYLDITIYSRQAATDPSLIAGDGLHPSGIEYHVWAEHLAPMIQSALQ